MKENKELYVNANEIPLGKFPETRTEWHQGWNDALEAVKESAPNINSVQIVRCQKCKHYEVEEDDFLGICKCDRLAKSNGAEIYPERDFFCAYGEPK